MPYGLAIGQLVPEHPNPRRPRTQFVGARSSRATALGFPSDISDKPCQKCQTGHNDIKPTKALTPLTAAVRGVRRKGLQRGIRGLSSAPGKGAETTFWYKSTTFVLVSYYSLTFLLHAMGERFIFLLLL